jgi:hypothetical protein
MMGDADNIQDCLVWEKSQEIPKEYGSMENL